MNDETKLPDWLATPMRPAGGKGATIWAQSDDGVDTTPEAVIATWKAHFPEFWPKGQRFYAPLSGIKPGEVALLELSPVPGAPVKLSTGVMVIYADDDATDVALAYVEGIEDGRRFFHEISAVAERMPVVLVKGGATSGGQRAAASHTGSLATDDRVFDGMCRQAGVIRARTIEEAYEVAATFATQPAPKGNKVAVVTTAGGWGVVTADAIAGTDLELLSLPDDLIAALDAELPPRWSRNNPIDLAGGETKDTIPAVLEAVIGHPDVDAVVLLGMGIQSNQGRMEAEGPFFPEWGLERIAAFHDRQDERYTTVAAQLAEANGKPVLVATELAVTFPSNAAVRGTAASGKLCYPSSNRAVHALARLWEHARWQSRRAG